MMALNSTQSGFTLAALLADIVAPEKVADCMISSLTLDSRKVKPGSLFIAYQGFVSHGLEYIEQALHAGAAAILCDEGGEWDAERISGLQNQVAVPLISIPKLRMHVSGIASKFYQEPSDDLSVIGITGTNGKTSCSHFLAQVLKPTCAVVGTLGVGFIQDLKTTGHTTPDAVSLQSELAIMKQEGAKFVAMEVSSHALDQGRVHGVKFSTAVFTNLSRDHLDYHGDMATYAGAKKVLFQMPGVGVAVVNYDDACGRQIIDQCPESVAVIAYGLRSDESVPDTINRWIWATKITHQAEGMQIDIRSSWGTVSLKTGLYGDFNVSNLLAVTGVLLSQGMTLSEAVERMASVQTVPGRMERFGRKGYKQVVVDYAHTPDALEHALGALRPHCLGRLICVVGCGGDRDRGKRPLMGAVAERLSDSVILTDDNPRGEAGEDIISDILQGMAVPTDVVVERNRRLAIERAIDMANADDMVLVAGKGHETTQQVGDLVLAFSDRDTVASLLEQERLR